MLFYTCFLNINLVIENYGDLRKSPLYFAVSNGDITGAEVLLAAGARTDLDPLRCILVAVRAERCVCFLIPNKLCGEGKSGRRILVECCGNLLTFLSRYELVQLLLSYGAEVNCYFRVISNTVFPTALQYCLRDQTMLRLLLNSGYQADKYVYLLL